MALLLTSLNKNHKKLNARMVPYAGWEMPVQYSGVADEHLTCRAACGLFDVSHMGEIWISGQDAEILVNELITNDIRKIQPGQAQYTLLCHPNGGVIDDLIIYKKTDGFLIVANAANTQKDWNWIQTVHAQFFSSHNISIQNVSQNYSQLAIQGRLAEKILSLLINIPLSEIKPFHFKEIRLDQKIPLLISRTGYTGEDGFELYLPWDRGPHLWEALLEVGIPLGLKPCGLAARDTLRLEAKFPLYGNELEDDTNPFEAGLGWVIQLNKPSFIGKSALEKKKTTTKRKLVGLSLTSPGILRKDYRVFCQNGETELGKITSGTQSPLLKKSIGLAYLPLPYSELGTPLKVEIRNQKISAEIIKTPFYKKNY